MDRLKKQFILALSAMVTKVTVSSLIDMLIDLSRPVDSETHGFYLACVNRVKTPGFRRGQEPPKSILLKSCTSVMHKKPIAFMELLFALLKLDKEKTKEVRSLIKEAFSSELKDLIQDVEEFCELVKKVTAKIKENIDIDWEEGWIYLLSGACILIPSEEEQEEIALAESEAACKVLKDIQAIPADDALWANLEYFFKKIIRLREQKINVGEKREKLKINLRRFHSKYGDGLGEFFELPVDNWKKEQLISGREDLALRHLAKLTELFNKYNRLDEKRPATVQERRDLRERLKNLETDIDSCQNDLSKCFAKPDPEPDRSILPNQETVVFPDESVRPKEEIKPTRKIKKSKKPGIAAQIIRPPNPVLNFLDSEDLPGAYWMEGTNLRTK